MVNILAAAVKNTFWQGANGVITEGSGTTSNNDGIGFKGIHYSTPRSTPTLKLIAAIFIRGLYEAFSRNPSNTNLRILVHSYIDVQVRILQHYLAVSA